MTAEHRQAHQRSTAASTYEDGTAGRRRCGGSDARDAPGAAIGGTLRGMLRDGAGPDADAEPGVDGADVAGDASARGVLPDRNCDACACCATATKLRTALPTASLLDRPGGMLDDSVSVPARQPPTRRIAPGCAICTAATHRAPGPRQTQRESHDTMEPSPRRRWTRSCGGGGRTGPHGTAVLHKQVCDDAAAPRHTAQQARRRPHAQLYRRRYHGQRNDAVSRVHRRQQGIAMHGDAND
jgi:hypothetical protein